MAYNLEEQEQLETLKAFWNRYGNFLVTIVAVLALSIAGWRAWGWYQERQSSQASVVYEQLRQAANARDIEKVREAAGHLFGDYSGTAYAEMAALVAARSYVDAGDAKSAKVPLQWAVTNADDPEFRHAARLRLARILLDEEAFDEGLKLLDVAASGQFAGLYADLRGDLLVAAGKPSEARNAYEQALEAFAADSPLRRLVQLKRDALGGETS